MSKKGTIVPSKKKIPSEVDRKSHSEQSGRSQLLLSNIFEAQCFSKLLENCIHQAELAETLPALLKLNSVSGFADKRFSRALQEYQILTERLEGTGRVSDGEQEVLDGKKRAQVKKVFQGSVRSLLRLVQAHPDVISDLKAEQNVEVGENESILINELKRCCSQVVEKLQTSVQEELEQDLDEVSFSPQILNLLNSMDEKLAAAVKEKDAMILEQNAKTAHFQKLLEELNKEDAALPTPGFQSPLPVKTSKMIQIEQEMDQIDALLHNLNLKRIEEEGVIQEEIEKMEKEVECLRQTFDVDMAKIQTHLDFAEGEYERELEELRTQELVFSVLKVEYDQILEKKRLEEEKRQQEMRDLELKAKAAIYAQAWWRGYKIRKALKNKDESEKAKKGKGKRKKTK